MKKMLPLSLCLVLLLTLFMSSCSSAPSEAPEASGADTSEESQDTAPSETDGAKVVVWNQIFEDWNQQFFTERGDEYGTLDRGYYVEQEFIPGDAWGERMTTARASNTAPDTYILAYNGIIPAARDQLILPLNDLFSQEAIDDILPNVKEMVSLDGQVYAYPQLVEPSTVLFYRTDLFEAAGLSEPPKTWDELLEYAELLQTNEVFGLGIAAGGDLGWATWGWQYSATGHLALNDNWDAPNLDGYAELGEFFKKAYDTGVVPAQALSPYADIKPFGEGALAMTFCGSWGIAQMLNQFPDMADKFAVAPAPTQDGSTDKTTATNGGWSYVIDAMSQNTEGAADYLSWLLAEDPETSAAFFELAQYSKAAPRQSVQDYLADSASGSEWAAVVSEISALAMPEPMYPWDISATVGLMFENIYLGAMSTDDAVAQAEQTIEDIIESQSLAGTNHRA